MTGKNATGPAPIRVLDLLRGGELLQGVYQDKDAAKDAAYSTP